MRMWSGFLLAVVTLLTMASVSGWETNTTVVFKKQALPMYEDATVFWEVPRDIAISRIDVAVDPNGMRPSIIKLMIRTFSGTVWQKIIPCDGTVTNSTAEIFFENWTCPFYMLPENPRDDIERIIDVGVYVRRHFDPSIQTFEIGLSLKEGVPSTQDGTYWDSDVRLMDMSMGIDQPSGEMEISWSTLEDQSYDIYMSTNLLEDFVVFASNVVSTPPRNTILVPQTWDRCFFKIMMRNR